MTVCAVYPLTVPAMSGSEDVVMLLLVADESDMIDDAPAVGAVPPVAAGVIPASSVEPVEDVALLSGVLEGDALDSVDASDSSVLLAASEVVASASDTTDVVVEVAG